MNDTSIHDNISGSLDDAGRRRIDTDGSRALQFFAGAFLVRRLLFEHDSDDLAARRAFAAAEYNLSLAYSKLSRHDQAADAAKVAVTHRRLLATRSYNSRVELNRIDYLKAVLNYSHVLSRPTPTS